MGACLGGDQNKTPPPPALREQAAFSFPNTGGAPKQGQPLDINPPKARPQAPDRYAHRIRAGSLRLKTHKGRLACNALELIGLGTVICREGFTLPQEKKWEGHCHAENATMLGIDIR